MSELGASSLFQSPVQWHLTYWLNVSVVGLLRGEDALLMAVRIESEFLHIANAQTRFSVERAWGEFQKKYRQE